MADLKRYPNESRRFRSVRSVTKTTQGVMKIAQNVLRTMQGGIRMT